MTATSTNRSRRAKTAARSKLYVQLAVPGEDTVIFEDVTANLGQLCPFKEPLASVAVEVTDDAVVFAARRIPKSYVKKWRLQELTWPTKPIYRARKVATGSDTVAAPGLVTVEHRELIWRYPVDVDAAGVLTLGAPLTAPHEATRATPGSAGSEPGGDLGDLFAADDIDDSYELGERMETVTVTFHSAAARRPVVVAYIGPMYDKAGAPTTVARTVSQVLRLLSPLADMRLLGGFESVDVPPRPRQAQRHVQIAGVRDPEVSLRVYPIDQTSMLPLVDGGVPVTVRVDMSNANPATGRLLVAVEPPVDIADAEVWLPMATDAVQQRLRELLGGTDAVRSLATDIVLGSVDTQRRDDVAAVLARVGDLDVTASQWRIHPN